MYTDTKRIDVYVNGLTKNDIYNHICIYHRDYGTFKTYKKDLYPEVILLSVKHSSYNTILDLFKTCDYSNYLIAKAIIENEN